MAELTAKPTREGPPHILASGVVGSAATALFGLGIAAAIPFACVNIAESVAGALLLRRLLPNCRDFVSLANIGGFLAVVGVGVPVIMGFFGAGIAHWSAGEPYWPNWLAFVAGHALGAITFTPLFMLAKNDDIGDWMRRAGPRDWAEAAVLLLGSPSWP